MFHGCQLLNLNLIHNFVSNIKGHISICVDKEFVCRTFSTLHASGVVAVALDNEGSGRVDIMLKLIPQSAVRKIN